MKMLVIPEDPTFDQYILEPVVERLFQDLEIPARIDVLRDPHLRGVDEALASVGDIVAENPMVDLFLLIVDRDCDRQSNTARVARCQGEHAAKLIATCAREEVETWMLALHRKKLPVGWSEVRGECDPKERYAEPFLVQQGWSGGVGRGRKRAMRELGKSYRGLLKACPEISELRSRIADWWQKHRSRAS